MSSELNSTPDGVTPNVAIIEFHDSRIGSIVLGLGGDAVIHFNHMNVFIEESANRYQVWDYRVDLELQGIEQVSLNRSFGTDDYVSDGGVYSSDGRRAQLGSTPGWTRADKVELVLSSTANLSFQISRARPVLVAPVEMVEVWIGPLDAQ